MTLRSFVTDLFRRRGGIFASAESGAESGGPSPLQLGIARMQPALSTLAPGHLYGIVCWEPELLLALAVGSLHRQLQNGGSAVLITPDVDAVSARLEALGHLPAELIAEHRILIVRMKEQFGEALSMLGVTALLDELEYEVPEEQAPVVAMSSEQFFSGSDPDLIEQQVARYRRWFGQHGRCGLFIFSFPNRQAALASPLLRVLQGGFSGFGWLGTEGVHRSFVVDYWSGTSDAVFEREYGIEVDPETILLLANGSEVSRRERIIVAAPDQHLVLATTAAVAGERGVPADWRILENGAALLEAAADANAATAVLSYTGQTDFTTLAQTVYQLRISRGRNLKIVVRERSHRLRYVQEALLLNLGANAVVYAEVAFSRFLQSLATLQNQVYARPMPEEFDMAVRAIEPEQVVGYVPPVDFCRHVRRMEEQAQRIGVANALLRLPLLDEVAHLDVLQACRPKRVGDVFTADRDYLYLFLFACREPDIDVSTEHIFKVPIGELFSSEIRSLSPESIEAVINQLQKLVDEQPPPDYSALLVKPAVPAMPARPARMEICDLGAATATHNKAGLPLHQGTLSANAAPRPLEVVPIVWSRRPAARAVR